MNMTEKVLSSDITGIEKAVRDVLSQLIDESAGLALAEQELASLGIDSLAFVRMVVLIETELDIEFEDDMVFFALPTVGAVIDYATKKVKEKEVL